MQMWEICDQFHCLRDDIPESYNITEWQVCSTDSEEYIAFILSMNEFDFTQNPCNLTVYRQISSSELL
jgi:hypothetical protein